MCHSRRRLFLSCGGALLIAPLAAFAQQPSKTWRIGFLTTRARPASLESDYLGAWVPKLRDLGYVEGKNLTIEWRFADDDDQRVQGLAAELVRTNPDLILVAGTVAARAAQKATPTIPIVIASVADPVGAGLVSSLSRPGGNITGLSNMAADISIKNLEFLRALVPHLTQVAVLFNPTNPPSVLALKQIRASAVPVGVGVAEFGASTAGQIDTAFAAMARARAQALIVAPDGVLAGHARQITELAAKNRLPAVYPLRPFVEAGGLMYYGQDIYENYRLAAKYIDRILKGARPGDLPVEQPTQMEFVMNRRAAEAIGLRIPQSVFLRATQVIE